MEKKLTKRQRLEAYIYAWLDIKYQDEEGLSESAFMCCSVRDYYDKITNTTNSGSILLAHGHFPELQKRKPVGAFYIWFDQNDERKNEKRLSILEECIDELLKQLEQ